MRRLRTRCRQFEEDSLALRRFDARVAAVEPTMGDPELNPLLERWHEAMWQITAIPAKTPAGIAAKGAALGHALRQCVGLELDDFDECSEDYERLAMSLVSDLATVPAR